MSSTEISFTEVKVFKKEYKEERSPRTLRINVSGTIFIVQLSSLRRFPNSRLARLADEYSLSSEPGTIYFDQDAMLFGHILRCCRSGEIHISALVCPCEFLRDMQFWGIPVEKISPCCWPTFYNADTVLSTFNKLTQMTPQPHAEDKNYTQLELKEKIWRFLDDPSHSRGAKVSIYLSIYLSMRRSHGVLGNRGTRSFISGSGELGNKGIKMRGTGEQRQFWGTRNIENQDFDFREQSDLFQGNKGTYSPGRAPSIYLSSYHASVTNEHIECKDHFGRVLIF